MIAPAVESALHRVYARVPKQRANYYELEILERVLNELVSNSGRMQPEGWQLRNARRNAVKVLNSRAQQICVAQDQAADGLPCGEDDIACFELMEWLRTTSVLQDEERMILAAVATDMTMESIAARTGFGTAALAVKLNRIRRKAWAGWLADAK